MMTAKYVHFAKRADVYYVLVPLSRVVSLWKYLQPDLHDTYHPSAETAIHAMPLALHNCFQIVSASIFLVIHLPYRIAAFPFQ